MSTNNVVITTIQDVVRVTVGSTYDNSSTVYIFNETPAGTINGSNATFTSLQNFVPDSLQVFINGVLQVLVNDYTTSGTTTINLNVSPVVGDVIRIHYKLG